MENVTRIVLGVPQHDVAEEVMHFLDRTGRARVVATAADERQLAEAVRQLEPDAVVATPELAKSAPGLNGSVLLALDTAESVRSLREAIRAGAKGFFVWPADREELAGAAARVVRLRHASEPRASVIAVLGARGGCGATFLATHLAAAFARRDLQCILVDADLAVADVTGALGVEDEGARTIVDVLPLLDEVPSESVAEALWRHAEGFRVLLAPRDAEAATRVRAGDLRACVEALRGAADVVLVHVPRGLDQASRAAIDAAERVVVVLQPDVASFRAARRIVDACAIEDRCIFVVNRAVRAHIVPKDVERVFGRPAAVVVPMDRAVPAAQDQGRLLPGRGRTGRAIARLAGLLREAPA